MSEPCSQRHTLPRHARIRSQQVFKGVFALRWRASDGWMAVYAARNTVNVVRLGISVGRRLGSAVRRNRVKRLIREAFRRIRHDLPKGLDLIVVPQPWPRIPTGDELQSSFRRLAGKLLTRLEAGEWPVPP